MDMIVVQLTKSEENGLFFSLPVCQMKRVMTHILLRPCVSVKSVVKLCVFMMTADTDQNKLAVVLIAMDGRRDSVGHDGTRAACSVTTA
jgi:hypothetical protein